MANVVNEIIQDVQFRTGVKNGVAILRAMNRVYARLNRKYRPIQKDLDIDFDGVYPTSSTWAKPDDMIEIYNVDPHYDYVTPDKWDDDYTGDVYTIDQGLFKFSNVSADTAVTVSYHSAGSTLVDAADADLDPGQENTPEWPGDLHQLLLYHTCMEVSADYPFMQKDLASLMDMEQRLGQTRWRVQSKCAEPIGGMAPATLSETSDDYED